LKVHHELPVRSPAYAAERTAHPLVVAVGFFDGFHLGHRAIVRELLRMRKPGERTAVVTFRDHPITHLRPGHQPPLIMTLEERINSIARAGIDETFVLRFDDSIATLGPREFLDEMLVKRIGACALIVGENFRFGAKRAGDIGFAREHLAERGLRFAAVPNELDGGERVSSTRVRAAIAAGDLAQADRLLGAPYTLRGPVALGFGRGHDLGFPTANIVVPPGKMLPPDGVYGMTGRHGGRDHRGLVSIGTNPTFDGTQRTVEAWLLDFSGSLYGEELALRDFRFVRAQQRFESVDALLDQMRADASTIRFPSFT
jgi:riboflavin kinase/FMN adenylyltransferase